jgi:hypothetical protein
MCYDERESTKIEILTLYESIKFGSMNEAEKEK